MAVKKSAKPDFTKVVQAQQKFFLSGQTKDVKFRLAQLDLLHKAIKNNEQEIMQALKTDLNKSSFESYATEIGMVLSEITYLKAHTKKWSKPKRVGTSLANFPAVSKVYPEPYGVSLIMSPWNYPLMLALAPLAGAIAAGNCAVVKPSRYSVATSKIIKKVIESIYPKNYICVIEGGHEENNALLQNKFDYIFFTGSVTVGKLVMQKASEFLTPVSLELGGKSPCIIDNTADVKLSARRIAWGKFLNAGQTCVAPDYVLISKDIKDDFIDELKKQIVLMFGESPCNNEDFPKIINDKHFKRLLGLAPKAECNKTKLTISPVIQDLTLKEAEKTPSMQEEIFGPILPVISYTNIDQAIEFVQNRPSPLALYIFSQDKKNQQTIISSIRYGSGCINDVIMQLESTGIPFGGIGNSGMGQYHGKYSFDTFTHYKGVLDKKSLDVPIRYAPYDGKLNLLKMFLK